MVFINKPMKVMWGKGSTSLGS